MTRCRRRETSSLEVPTLVGQYLRASFGGDASVAFGDTGSLEFLLGCMNAILKGRPKRIMGFASWSFSSLIYYIASGKSARNFNIILLTLCGTDWFSASKAVGVAICNIELVDMLRRSLRACMPLLRYQRSTISVQRGRSAAAI